MASIVPIVGLFCDPLILSREWQRHFADRASSGAGPATAVVGSLCGSHTTHARSALRLGSAAKSQPPLVGHREEWAKPRGRKSQHRHCGKAIEAQPSCGQIASSMRPRRRVLDGLQGKSCVRGTPQEPASQCEKSGNLAHAEAPRIPEPCPAEKCSLRRCSVRRYRRALSHRRGNSAFTSMTADTAEHHPTDGRRFHTG
jgi:hypothetical protein